MSDNNILYNLHMSLYCSFMNHFVHMGIFSLYIFKMSFYCIMLSVKASSHDTTMLWLYNILCLLFFLVHDFLLYVTIMGAISHTLCVYNGTHISHVFLPHLLHIYLFIYCEMKTNELNWIEYNVSFVYAIQYLALHASLKQTFLRAVKFWFGSTFWNESQYLLFLFLLFWSI